MAAAAEPIGAAQGIGRRQASVHDPRQALVIHQYLPGPLIEHQGVVVGLAAQRLRVVADLQLLRPQLAVQGEDCEGESGELERRPEPTPDR